MRISAWNHNCNFSIVSLMSDQVKALNQAGVHAAYINSTLTENQIRMALAYAAQGKYTLIYVAPERLNTMQFLDFACHAEDCHW